MAVGTFSGFGVVALLQHLMSEEAMNDIGWRICFWLGLLVGAVGLFLRSKVRVWWEEKTLCLEQIDHLSERLVCVRATDMVKKVGCCFILRFVSDVFSLLNVDGNSRLLSMLMFPGASGTRQVSDPEEFVQARELVGDMMNQHPLYVVWRIIALTSC